MEELRFDDHVVVVTGAGRGIGRAHALLFAARGAHVVVADLGADLDGSGISTGPADEVVAEIEAAGGTAVACYASVADEAGATSIVTTAIETFGRIDVLVNNAGINDTGSFDELSVDAFRRMLDVHFFGTLFTVRAAWPHFVAAGGGRIVNTVSEAILGIDRMAHYAAAKGAVFALTRCLATEGEPLGIKVNAIAPRAFTRMAAANTFANAPQKVIDKAKQIASPEMNSPAVVYLAHESCPLTGEVLRSGMGGLGRLAVVHTVGLDHQPEAPEDIALNLDTVLDLADAEVADHRWLAPKPKDVPTP